MEVKRQAGHECSSEEKNAVTVTVGRRLHRPVEGGGDEIADIFRRAQLRCPQLSPARFAAVRFRRTIRFGPPLVLPKLPTGRRAIGTLRIREGTVARVQPIDRRGLRGIRSDRLIRHRRRSGKGRDRSRHRMMSVIGDTPFALEQIIS